VAILALAALAPPQFANSEEIFRQTEGVACRPDGTGCDTFEGHIYVRNNGEASPVRGSSDSADTLLRERRLYLHMGASESP
jgi:hypothetical protein